MLISNVVYVMIVQKITLRIDGNKMFKYCPISSLKSIVILTYLVDVNMSKLIFSKLK